ncbi:MAG: hypothetical protein EHM56_13735 [Chloroflexi bacterium]|nr:MAG: hypothetical protein EHM56_13735 [Chloroflexota bacterium]
MESLRAAMAAHPDGVDFRRLCAPAREAVKERICEKMRLFGASGRANGSGPFWPAPGGGGHRS